MRKHLPLCLALLAVTRGFHAQGQTNLWTNQVSGKWEVATNWSLGVAPAAAQSVFITNAGSDLVLVPNAVVAKRVSIDSVTASSFSNTMTVSNLTLCGAGSNVVNWLALTNAGTSVPLHILRGFSVARGGLFTMDPSSLQVDGSVSLGASPPSQFTALYPATFVLSSGSAVVASNFTLTAAADAPATLLVQNGGDLEVTNGLVGIGSLGLATGFGTGVATIDNSTLGAWNLFVGSVGGQGTLYVTNNSTLNVGSNLTVMSLIGSSVTSSVAISGGALIATNGTIQVGPFGNGVLTISGGNHKVREIDLGSPGTNAVGSGSCYITGGTTTILGTGPDSNGFPGFGFIANFILLGGGDVDGSGTTLEVADGHNAAFVMTNGYAQFAAAYIGYSDGYVGTFTQSNGTFVVSSNMAVGQDCYLGPDGAIGTVSLYGGTLFVTNAAHTALLQVSNGTFTVNAGATLIADNIESGGACAQLINNGGRLFYNLLFNPGAETGDNSGWAPSGSYIGVDNGSYYGIQPHTGNFDFIGGGGYSGGTGSLSQSVPLVGNNGVTAAAIDSGAFTLGVSFWEQTADPTAAGPPYDGAQVSVSFLDESFGVIGSSSTPVLASTEGWTNETAQYLLPPGTRFIQYTMEFVAQGNPDFVYVDDNFLSLYPVQPPLAPSLTLSQAGTNVLLSWSASATNYVVQTTTNFLAPNSWQTLTNLPASIDGALVLTNALTDPARFYRLRSQ